MISKIGCVVACSLLAFSTTAVAQEPTPEPTQEQPAPTPLEAPTPAPTPWGRTTSPGATTGSPDDFHQGFDRGCSDAQVTSPLGWGVCGLAGGTLCGVIGCLGATGTAFLVNPNPAAPGGTSMNYYEGYKQGYSSTIKKRRATAAFIGGAIGATAAAVYYFAVYVPQQNRANGTTQIRLGFGLVLPFGGH